VTLSLSSCHSNRSDAKNAVLEETEVDDYEILRNPGKALQQTTEDLSGNVIIISERDFIDRITELSNPKGFQYKGKTPCIVALYTLTCKPSSIQAQVLNNTAPKYQGKVIFYKIDIDRAPEVAFQFNVKSTPTFLYFKPHSPISATKGFMNQEELKNAIDKYLLNP
jgi:thioredoxin 1